MWESTGEGRHRPLMTPEPMNDRTRAALLELAAALAADPDALQLLSTTYPISEHLLDLIHDLEEHPATFAA
jgi:hypothetical protein